MLIARLPVTSPNAFCVSSECLQDPAGRFQKSHRPSTRLLDLPVIYTGCPQYACIMPIWDVKLNLPTVRTVSSGPPARGPALQFGSCCVQVRSWSLCTCMHRGGAVLSRQPLWRSHASGIPPCAWLRVETSADSLILKAPSSVASQLQMPSWTGHSADDSAAWDVAASEA